MGTMFFLVPAVTLVLLAAFALLGAWRAWRQRHGRSLRRREWGKGRGGGRHRWRWRDGVPATGLVPAALLRGADETCVVFTTPRCHACHKAAVLLRAMQPPCRVVEVDATREPRLAEAFRISRLPAVLVANRYGQVEARLIGMRAIDEFAAGRCGAP